MKKIDTTKIEHLPDAMVITRTAFHLSGGKPNYTAVEWRAFYCKFSLRYEIWARDVRFDEGWYLIEDLPPFVVDTFGELPEDHPSSLPNLLINLQRRVTDTLDPCASCGSTTEARSSCPLCKQGPFCQCCAERPVFCCDNGKPFSIHRVDRR